MNTTAKVSADKAMITLGSHGMVDGDAYKAWEELAHAFMSIQATYRNTQVEAIVDSLKQKQPESNKLYWDLMNGGN